MSKLHGLFDDLEEDNGTLSSGSSVRVSDSKANVGPQEPIGLTALPRSGMAPISTAMMDEALQRVLERQELRPELAATFSSLASRDHNSPFSHTYYASKQAAVHSTRAGVTRQRIKIKPVLDDKEIEAVQSYAPEFQLEFVNTSSVDHSMAHIMRKIDHRLLWARVPAVGGVADVGGNPIYYMHEGFENVHVCGKVFDNKDASRYVLRDATARTLAGRPNTDPAVKRIARSYLDKDPRFVCGKLAQECTHKSPVILSLHVYDIPLADWPEIMKRRDAHCVEGCMLFSDKILNETSGTLGLAAARFEVDPATDVLRMGFSDSPSLWYTHSWSQYCKYGTDQVFQARDSNEYFTYKITERRGDTIFFRMLRGRGKQPAKVIGGRRSPNINLVKVHGFELCEDESVFDTLKRKVYYFPEKLWINMVNQASEDYERGVLDFAAMYRYYRTVSVRQTVNAVLIIGGEPVSHDQLVPLIVHSCLAAALQSTLGQRETRGLTCMAMLERATLTSAAFSHLRSVLVAFVKLPLTLALAPFVMLYKGVKKLTLPELEQFLVTWEPSVEVVRVPLWRLNLRSGEAIDVQCIESQHDDLKLEAQQALMHDHCAAMVRNPELYDKFLSVETSATAAGVAKTEESTLLNNKGADARFEQDTASAKPKSEPTVVSSETPSSTTYFTEGGPNIGMPTIPEEDFENRHKERIAAITEYIQELQVTMRATESSCAVAFRHLTAGGKPRAQLLISSDDHYEHPDIWDVEDGRIVRSVRGLTPKDFNHSAVYSPDLLSDGSCIKAVTKTDNMDSRHGKGKEKEPDVFIMGSHFTGYVLTNDSLAVYNGEEILDTLRLALTCRHDYHIKVVQAPPGCGKTHTIKQLMRTDGSDFFSCPVRQSALSTRAEFAREHPEFTQCKDYMRTVDSYLVNHAYKNVADITAKRLLADELYMTHAGKWYAMAGLLQVTEVWGYGDLLQIPHIPRVEVASIYLRVRPDEEDGMWMNYRNPVNAVAAWGHLYGNRLRAVSQVEGKFEQIGYLPTMEIYPGTVMMCMYQATKIELAKLYKRHLDKIIILTAHESEGKTFDHVWLHKLDTRVRTDKSSLYDSEPHCLVAASRHRNTFYYVNLGADDLISTWVKNSKDPNKIILASDLDSVGEISLSH
ncbi:replicase [Erysiphe necator associated ssRNA virus 8]|nr:replicase [Erysiphe necator associated ssRNA virus 8]